jgi:hypothetical protein
MDVIVATQMWMGSRGSSGMVETMDVEAGKVADIVLLALAPVMG